MDLTAEKGAENREEEKKGVETEILVLENNLS